QAANAIARQTLGGVGQLVGNGMMLHGDQVAQHPIAAQHHQPAPQLRLEHDQQADDDPRQQVVEDLAQFVQVEAGDDDLGDQEEPDDEQGEAADHAGPARFAQKAKDGVDGQRQDDDFHEIAEADRFDELGQPSSQG